MSSQPIYALRRAEVFDSLETAPEGLTQTEAAARLELYGRNALAEPPQPPAWKKWLRAVSHPAALLLWGMGALTLLGGKPSLAVVIWGVVLINGTFSFAREYWAGRSISRLKDLLPQHARVLRDGQDRMIPTEELAPGDVLSLAEGDRVPADARVVEEFGLRINQAALTGESLPVHKSAEASLRADLAEIERSNLIFAGTSVLNGTCRAVVFNTGMLTEFGRIANLTQAVREAPSGLQQEMTRLSRVLTIIALGIGAIVLLAAQTDVGLPFQEALLLAAGIVIAVIPEGLHPTLTITLAVGAQRLAQHGVWVKRFSTLETLGNTSVVCTDKSGTLTQNQMTVRKLWVARRVFTVSGVGYAPEGKIRPEKFEPTQPSDTHADLQSFLTAGVLCNNARLCSPSANETRWTSLGDQTEVALLTLGLKGGLVDVQGVYPRIHELPFDAQRKRMSTIHRCDGQEVAFVKGAPKEVLQLCSHILINNQVAALTPALREEILQKNDSFSRQSMRVLALARRMLPVGERPYLTEKIERELVFLGLAAMMDPPRPEVAAAMEAFRSAGIRVIIITGDYGLTAESLARRVGMIHEETPRIITGVELDEMSEADLQATFAHEVIFARMAPDHKLRVVAALQAQGETVAVIGDGVNDVPALRKADIGVAMGQTGTDVAREAADVVLTGDNFALLTQAIQEGRAVYDNLRKFITYIFASNVPELLPFLLTAVFHLPFALTVLQILVIDLGTDLFPALALGMEKPEPDILTRQPRKGGMTLIDRSLLIRSIGWLGVCEALLCYFGLGWVFGGGANSFLGDNIFTHFIRSGLPAEGGAPLAASLFLGGVVFAQIGNAFACRSERGHLRWLGLFSNPILLGAVAIEGLLIVAMIQLPPLARELGLAPLPLALWGWLILYAPILYGVERTRKNIFRWLRQKGIVK